MTKELKMYPDFFAAIKSETKSVEIRKNDDDFQIGDTLLLKEFDPSTGFTGRCQERVITYTALDGLKNGYILMEMEVLS